MFHTRVTIVLSECCICFTHMLQQYVSSTQTYVASKYFMLQMFRGYMMRDGRTALAPGDGAAAIWGQRTGRNELGADSRVSPTRRERRGSRGRSEAQRWEQGACARRGRDRWGQATRPSRREEWRAQRRGRGARASRTETRCAGVQTSWR